LARKVNGADELLPFGDVAGAGDPGDAGLLKSARGCNLRVDYSPGCAGVNESFNSKRLLEFDTIFLS
jgi:hypothetical protein